MRKRRRTDAVHEAGHAAVALVLGVRVRAVVIGCDSSEEWGYVEHFDIPPERQLHDCLIAAAGPAADVLTGRFGRRVLRATPTAWGSDYEYVRERKYSRAEWGLLVRMASRLLENEANHVWRRIIEALMRRDLNESDLNELISP